MRCANKRAFPQRSVASRAMTAPLRRRRVAERCFRGTCRYAYLCTHVCTCLNMYVNIMRSSRDTHVDIHACTHVYTYVRTLYTGLHTSDHTCLCACMSVHMSTHWSMHMSAQISRDLFAHMSATCPHAKYAGHGTDHLANQHVYGSCLHAWLNACPHTCPHIRLCICMCTCIWTRLRNTSRRYAEIAANNRYTHVYRPFYIHRCCTHVAAQSLG